MKSKSRRVLSALIIFINHLKRFGYWEGASVFFKTVLQKKGILSLNLTDFLYPIKLRTNTSDVRTFWQVLLDQEYEFGLAFKPKFIIDCGSNIGLASVFFKKKFPDAFIVAVEPESSNYDILKQNLQLYDNVSFLQKGIWNKAAYLSVSDEYNLGEWGFIVKETPTQTADTIEAVTIIDIMQQFGYEEIDILKIDIEGSEAVLFASNYEAWLPVTKVVIIELHDWLNINCSQPFFNAMNRYNFSMIIRGENLVFKNLNLA